MNTINPRAFAGVVDADALRTYVQRVSAWIVASSETLLQVIFGSPLMWVVLLAPLAMVWILSSRIDKMQPSTAAGMFIAYSLLNGVAFASLFVIYELGSIFQVFLIAAGMYAAAAVYGYTTKRDLTSMGSFMVMGLVGLIIASVVNMFLGSGAFDWAISVIGVVIFTGLTAWDMQRIKEQAVVMYAGDALAAKRSIIGALSLYLNFINLFLFLLRLLGDRR
jgi:FtsH-binding integral membrane protein